MKKIIALILLFTCINSFANAQPVIKYTLRFDDAQAHYVQVLMEVSNWKSEKLNVSMPVWAPGSYMVREFERHVEGFNAFDNKGNNLLNQKINKATWQIETKSNSTIKINYRVYAFEMSVRSSFVDDEHAFLNGSSIFMYIDKMLTLPSTVEIIPTKNWKQITTTLDAANGNKWIVTAPDYDLLADSPIEIGNHEVIEFKAAGVTHLIAMIGKGNYDANRIKKDVPKILEAETKIFGEQPCKRYVFFVQNQNTPGGGLEHLNSCSLQMNRWAYEPEGTYQAFLNLIAHEYFHLWNVKRIRPRTLLHYDYSTENYTDLLYVAEGFTAYYDDFIPVRCGFILADSYLNTLAGSFTYVENPGDTIQTLTEASYDAWIKYYRPNENAANTTSNYYTKGSLVALLINLTVMDATNGNKSLDDVMRLLYETTYKKEWIGYTEQDLISAIKTVSGVDMNSFFENHVHRTARINYNSFLEKAGLRLRNKNENQQSIYHGITTSFKEGKLNVTNVERNSPAWKDGINVNDELIAIDSVRLADDLNKALQFKNIGDKIFFTINRNGLIKSVALTLVNSPKAGFVLERVEKPTEKQDLIYKTWLHL